MEGEGNQDQDDEWPDWNPAPLPVQVVPQHPEFP